MATTVARLEAILSADTRDFDQSMDRSQGKMSKVGKAAGVAGLAIAAGLGVAAKIGFDEMMQGEKVTAQTNAVLKSTGGVANVTAKEIDKLAGSLMKKSGVDDEQIKAGSNMLLTFTKIRNETGAGNKVFDEATKATLNLSVAMGKDMQSSALLVGKALNDPIKGMGALSRAGVQFDADQKNLIKTMVASGDTMGAQKMILKELETQFGGSAVAAGKTLGGQVNIAKESFSNLSGELVKSLMPAFTSVIGVLSKATSWMSENQTATKVIVGVLAGLAVVLGVVSVATTVYAAAVKIAAAGQWLMNAAMSANPIGLVIIGLVALGAALYVAWQKSETFRDIVVGAWEAIKRGIEPVVRFFTTTVPNAFQSVINWVRQNWPILVTLLAGPFAPLVALGTNAFGLRDIMGNALTGVANKIKEMAGAIAGWGKSVGTWIKDAVVDGILGIGNAVWNVVNNIWDKYMEMGATIKGWGKSVGTWIKNAVVSAVTGIGSAAWDVINNIGEFIADYADAIRRWGTHIGTWIKNAVVNAITGIGGAAWGTVNNIWEFIEDRADTIKGWGTSIGNWIKNAIVNAFKGIGNLLWNKVKGGVSGLGDKLVAEGKSLIPGWGDARDPNMTLPSVGGGGGGVGVGSLMGAGPELAPFASQAARFGLGVSSGFRPGAITANGTPSDHGRGKAIDVAGPAAGMMGFIASLFGNRMVKQAFYDPYGSLFGGVRSSYREGGHSDHVHVATYDKGGWLMPGLTLAQNNTGRPERIVGPGGGDTYVTINVPGLIGDRDELARRVADILTSFKRGGGQLGFA